MRRISSEEFATCDDFVVFYVDIEDDLRSLSQAALVVKQGALKALCQTQCDSVNFKQYYTVSCSPENPRVLLVKGMRQLFVPLRDENEMIEQTVFDFFVPRVEEMDASISSSDVLHCNFLDLEATVERASEQHKTVILVYTDINCNACIQLSSFLISMQALATELQMPLECICYDIAKNDFARNMPVHRTTPTLFLCRPVSLPTVETHTVRNVQTMKDAVPESLVVCLERELSLTTDVTKRLRALLPFYEEQIQLTRMFAQELTENIHLQLRLCHHDIVPDQVAVLRKTFLVSQQKQESSQIDNLQATIKKLKKKVNSAQIDNQIMRLKLVGNNKMEADEPQPETYG